jgi:hypothetical protein
MAGRLGATDTVTVDTIVITYLIGSTSIQIRAFKVGCPTSNSCPSDGLTYFSPESPQVETC